MSRESRPWLVVEGDSDESLLRTRNFFRPIKIVVGHGWEGVRDIIVEYNKEQTSAILLGLIDRDYRDHRNCQLRFERLVLTDYRDIENMLFNSSALARVLSEYASMDKIPKENNDKLDLDFIRNCLYTACVQIGRFRVFCEKNDFFIDFKKIDYRKFVCDRTLLIDSNKFLENLRGKNQNKKCLTQANWDTAQSLVWPGQLGEPEYIANGHDLMALLGIALRRLWGSHSGGIKSESLEEVFRIGYSDEDLIATEMWCNLNRFLEHTC
ncbi:DUF4435 domain-containing protein [Pectobacterium carotovorum]|uniref:DUF4435 domain-containing protein n=1 Tax=Pectobacterium carotovorum TaxID=554 RepID=UPI003017CCB2